jgi:trk system potassium uptake protein TrkH
MFETASGFTTTGASILTNVEAMSHTSLMWRSLTHWIGGMGVLVFLLAVVPMAGGSNMNLMRAESPGPSVGKIVPKVRSTAKMLYLIYLALTVTEILILFICGMPLFDSICSAFGTAGTGGFGVRNDSFASYAPHIQWIVAVFMIMFGANFNFYYYLTTRQIAKAFKMSEIKVFLIVIAFSTGIICFSVRNFYGTFEEALRHSFFQVSTIITTTGFATTDFDLWPTVAKFLILSLMIIGACASSTGGGIKIARFQIMFKTIKREIHTYIHPRTVKKIHVDGKTVDTDVEHSVALYFFIYLLVFALSLFIVSFEGHDLVTCFSSVAATLNNIGPGLSMVGPTQNYSFFSVISKWVFIFDMLAGRLELMPLIVFLNPATYKGIIKKPAKAKG